MTFSGAGGRAWLVVLPATVRSLLVSGTPEFVRERVQLVWLRRWRNLLVCSAAEAFGLSLVERRFTVGVGCIPPSVDEVVRKARAHRRRFPG